jgi:signal transduction histidine kinase
LSSHFYQQQTAESSQIYLLATIVTTISVAALVLSWLLLERIKSSSRSVIASVISISLIGAGRGALTYFLAIELGVNSEVSLAYRVFNSCVTTLTWVLFICYLSNGRRNYKEKYRLLFIQSLITQTAKETGLELTNQLQYVEKSLKKINLLSLDTPITPERLNQAAAAVKLQIDELIRPLSQRLWVPSSQDYPRIKPFRLIGDAVLNLNYPYFPVAVVIGTLNFVNYNSLMTPAQAIYRVAIELVVITIIFLAFAHLPAKSQSVRLAISLTHLVALASLPAIVGDLFLADELLQSEASVTLLIYLGTPLIALSFSMIKLIESDRKTLIELIALPLASEYTYHRSQVASYLHNSLQSDLLAMSKKLQDAANSSDINAHRESLEQLAALLNRSITQEFESFYESPSDRLAKLVDSWSGIIEIKIHNSKVLLTDVSKSMIAIRVIEELASNAAKHSQATELEVFSTISDDLLNLTVTADSDFEEISQSGYGTELLTAVTKSWSSAATVDNKTRIEIVI